MWYKPFILLTNQCRNTGFVRYEKVLLRWITVYIADSFLVLVRRYDPHCPVRQRDEFLEGIVLVVEVRLNDDHGVFVYDSGYDSGMVEIGCREN